MVGRVDDVIKGAQYGLYAMAEIVKEVPDVRLTTEIKYYAPLVLKLNLIYYFKKVYK